MTGDASSGSENRRSPNSALTWYPAMAQAADETTVEVPETEFVDIPEMDVCARYIDGENPDEFPFDVIAEDAESLGYPVFVRTDITSAKHHGLDGYRARDEDELRVAVRWALEANYMAMGTPHPSAIMLRDWIELDYGFHDDRRRITDEGVRIAREFRFFADPEMVRCQHFYWPEDSMQDPDRDDWREQLVELSKIGEYELDELCEYAEACVEHAPGDVAWSVDVAADQDGNWWGIDMALAGMSWHPEDCAMADEFEDPRMVSSDD